MKKFVSFLLAIVIAAGALIAAPIQLPGLVVSASAEETSLPEETTSTPEDTTTPVEEEPSETVPAPEYTLSFTLLGDGNAYSVSGYTGTPVNVIIPAEYEGLPVTVIADRVFENCVSLKTVEIPNTITRIGYMSFWDCNALEELTIPGSVKEIDNYAFSNCSNLKTLTFLDGANGITYNAFENCKKIEKINLPETHVNLTAAHFKGSVIYKDKSNWYGNSFYIGNQLINTTWYAHGARTVRPGTTHINPLAYASTENLIALTIPASVKHIGDDVFKNSSISVIYYEGTESQFNQIDIGNNGSQFKKMAIVCGINKNNIPKKPTVKKLSNVAGGVQITWNKVSNADLYAVYRRGSGTTRWTLLGITTENSVIDTSAEHRKFWRYSVQALNDDGVSAFDKNGKYLKYVETPKLTGLYNKANGMQLTWNAVEGASGYRVYRRASGQGWRYLGTVKGTSYLDKVVKNHNGKYYRYTVRAVVDKRYSGYEDYLYAMRLTAPKLVSAKYNDRVQLVLKWETAPSATGYDIYGYHRHQNCWTYIGHVNGGKKTSYILKEPTYYNNFSKYSVVATNGKYKSELNTKGFAP